ncbi:MAG: 2-C-methyl-D-erythritol 2,4-cyclodiphosphate synthase [Fimbriimonadaceae bacterium]|nr:2-C-methyl-D-erythritol 2,4-cyclodiphosphate synthase [Fimbriimonadaceae bacterium]
MSRAASAAVIPAAGSGTRFGAPQNKLLQPLAGQTVLYHTLRAVGAAGLQQVVLVTRPDERDTLGAVAAAAGCAVTFADGGPTRQASVIRGLQQVRAEIALVAVHDGARPLVTPELFHRALDAAAAHGGAVVAVPVADTLKRVATQTVVGAVDRSELYAMQTPQAFRVEWLREAAQYAAVTGFEGTDEVSLIEHWGRPVRVVPGAARNVKVTHPADLELAAALLGGREEQAVRVGYGYDIHQLVAGRQLWLGGVRIEHETGLLGHSDADVLLHAICDALLGAIGDGDIGRHFPDTDPAYRGIASLRLLEATAARVDAAGYQVVNVDATLIAERPKIAPHVGQMIARIAAAAGLRAEQINIKATTNEKLGALGQQQGIAAHAVASVVRR